MSTSRPQVRVVPVLNGDEARYRRRYRTLKDMVNDLSDETNLLALRVHQIQRRLYDAHMAEHGTPPPPVEVPEGASWAPLVQNAVHYPADVGKPRIRAKPRRSAEGSHDGDGDGDGDGGSSDVEPRAPSNTNGTTKPRVRSSNKRPRSESVEAEAKDEDEGKRDILDEVLSDVEKREERDDADEGDADDESGEEPNDRERNVDADIEDMMDDY